jgi:hypothetical protein
MRSRPQRPWRRARGGGGCPPPACRTPLSAPSRTRARAGSPGARERRRTATQHDGLARHVAHLHRGDGAKRLGDERAYVLGARYLGAGRVQGLDERARLLPALGAPQTEPCVPAQPHAPVCGAGRRVAERAVNDAPAPGAATLRGHEGLRARGELVEEGVQEAGDHAALARLVGAVEEDHKSPHRSEVDLVLAAEARHVAPPHLVQRDEWRGRPAAVERLVRRDGGAEGVVALLDGAGREHARRRGAAGSRNEEQGRVKQLGELGLR